MALLPGPAEAAMFAAAVLVLNATPGVDVLLTITRSMQGGWRAGVAAVAGINAGCVLHALAAAFGLAALLALHPGLFKALQWAGAAYLFWMGLGLLRQAARAGAVGAGAGAGARSDAGANAGADAGASAGANAGSSAGVSAGVSAATGGAAGAGAGGAAHVAADSALRPWLADVRSGFLTNLLNPKVALFFLAFLPQFVPAASSDKRMSFLLLGAWFVLQSSLFSLALVAVVARVKTMAQPSRLRSAPALQRSLQALAGLLFVALALRLLRERPDTV